MMDITKFECKLLLVVLLIQLIKQMWHHQILVQNNAAYAPAYDAHTNSYYVYFSAYACLYYQRSLKCFYSAYTVAFAMLILLCYVNFSAHAWFDHSLIRPQPESLRSF